MKSCRALRQLAVLFLAFAGPALATWADAAEAPQGRTGPWSEIVDGIRGRLVITDGDVLGKPKAVRTDGDRTFCVYAELQNAGPQNRLVPLYRPYCFQNGEFAFELLDPAGEVVPRANGFVGYDAFPNTVWLQLPPDSTIRFPVTTGGFEAVHDGGRLSVGLEMDRRWILSSGATERFRLLCRFSPAKGGDFAKAPPAPGEAFEVWNGSLELPGVALPERRR
jgi:hypothetical protein